MLMREAPIPAYSCKVIRHRPSCGSDRRPNAIPIVAANRITCHPETGAYVQLNRRSSTGHPSLPETLRGPSCHFTSSLRPTLERRTRGSSTRGDLTAAPKGAYWRTSLSQVGEASADAVRRSRGSDIGAEQR